MMNKLILFFVSLVQMSLLTWFWIILGLEWKGKFHRIAIFVTVSALIITLFLPQTSILGHRTRYIAYILIFLTGKIIFSKSLKEIAIDLFSVFFIFYFIQSLQILLYRSVYPSMEIYYSNITCFSSIFVMNFMVFIFIIIVYLSNRLTELLKDYKREVENNLSLIVFMGASIVLIQINWDLYGEVIWKKYYIFFPVIWTIFFLNLIGIKKSIEVFENRKEIELYKKHYDIISEMLEDAKRRQHEFKNHLTTIYCLHQFEDDPENMKKYIKSVSRSVKIAPSILKLHNKIIAAVIYNKVRIAKENDIKFEYHLNHGVNFPIADYQLVEIISNLLKNAFEALQDKDIIEKRVLLEIDIEENRAPYILVKNNGQTLLPSEIPLIFKRGFSKKDGSRGYGLYNVKRIVKRNSGQLEVFLDNEYTIFKVIF